jgi:hypothetical protein
MTPQHFSLRDNAMEEPTPWGIFTVDEHHISAKPLQGEWLRVFPQTGRDVNFLRLLAHQEEKYAPMHGCGVLIRAELLFEG